ncbi:glutaredoxin family protein [Planococcus lenghuensis]|uniref:Thiol-disulfide isomerase n=1 Tax=Planococcus lenghuensis TaxID=2213202 RepID=A0A1Q2KX25_9BACL|nr:glutaredoxin family protein [Planococcus lenghuensis]AQQ52664.1 thiol-disulfide isomerase [Planococcus lenghuensis]
MLVFYTKKNCGLCEEAERMLELIKEDFPIEYRKVDIEQDEQLHEKYMLMIPVIEQEDKVLLYGNIGYVDLLEALKL